MGEKGTGDQTRLSRCVSRNLFLLPDPIFFFSSTPNRVTILQICQGLNPLTDQVRTQLPVPSPKPISCQVVPKCMSIQETCHTQNIEWPITVFSNNSQSVWSVILIFPSFLEARFELWGNQDDYLVLSSNREVVCQMSVVEGVQRELLVVIFKKKKNGGENHIIETPSS